MAEALVRSSRGGKVQAEYGPVKKRVSLAEAAKIALRILSQAEEARRKVAEAEAMTAMAPEEMTAMAYKQHLARQCGEWNKQQLALPDRYHNKCPECSRVFVNNISCPRCGWRLRGRS